MPSSFDLESLRDTTTSPDPQDPQARNRAAEEKQKKKEQQSTGDDYGDTSAQLWTLSISEGEKYDKILAEGFSRDMDSTLVFTGLFSAIVAAFLIESYKTLNQDPADATVLLLSQIYQQLSANANGTTILPSPPPANQVNFRASNASVAVNVCWFLSLVFSISCALAATLVQQWSRKYLQTTQLRSSPHTRARIRAYLHEGILSFRMSTVVDTIPLLLHISVFLFFGGLIEFLWNVHITVAIVVLSAVSVCAGAYLLLTVAPMLRHNCPYQTPISAPMWRVAQALFIAASTAATRAATWARPTSDMALFVLPDFARRCRKRFFGGVKQNLEFHAAAARDIDPIALKHTLRALRDDAELEPFVEGVPGFIKSRVVEHGVLTIFQLLHLDAKLGVRIGRLLKTCAGRVITGMTEAARVRRALTCMSAMWHLTAWYVRERVPCWELDFGVEAVDALKVLKKDKDADVAVVAHCTAALGATALLHELSTMRPSRNAHAEPVRKAVVALMNMPKHLQEGFMHRDGAGQDEYFFTLIDFVAGTSTHMRRANESSMELVCESLKAMVTDDSPNNAWRASQSARDAFASLWRELDNLFDGFEGSWRMPVPDANGGYSPSMSSERTAVVPDMLMPSPLTLGPRRGSSSSSSFGRPYPSRIREILSPIARGLNLPMNQVAV